MLRFLVPPVGEVCQKAPSVRPSSHSSNHKNGQDAVLYCMYEYICLQKCSQDGVGTSGATINSSKTSIYVSLSQTLNFGGAVMSLICLAIHCGQKVWKILQRSI